MPPETIGRYRLFAPIGGESDRMVYRAVAEETNQIVALRLLPQEALPDAAARKRFLEEAHAAARLSHPGIRQVYEVGQNQTHFYVAMEYLEGAPLQSLLVAGPVAVESALAWGAELADALAAAHAGGVVQGELRSAKVFITSQGTAKLLDTGLWRVGIPAGTDLTQWKMVADSLRPGTLAALAPEQIRGQLPDPRSDLFGLGTLLYEMITGANPFASRHPEQTLHWVLKRTPPPIVAVASEVPAALNAVLEKALAKEPKARFSNAAQFASALRAVAAGEPGGVPLSVEPAPAEWWGGRGLVWIGLAALLVLLLALAYFLRSGI